MQRPDYEFDVPMEWAGVEGMEGAVPIGWLTPDLLITRDPNAPRLRFAFRLYPTGLDERAIERETDRLNGGPENTHDLDQAVATQWAIVRSIAIDRVWPEGRPDPKTPDDLAEDEAKLDAEYRRMGSERHMLERTRKLVDDTRQLAEWRVLIVSPADPIEGKVVEGEDGSERPATWADLADLPMHPRARMAILRAQRIARDEAEEKRGNW